MKPVATVRKNELAEYLSAHQLTAVSAMRRNTRVVFANSLAPVVAAAQDKRLVRVAADGRDDLPARMQRALATQGYALIRCTMRQMRHYHVFPVFEQAMRRLQAQLGDVVTVLEPGYYGRFFMFCVARSDYRADLLAQTRTFPADAAES